MLKGNPALMMLYYLSFFTVIGVREIAHENFREAVIRLLAILRVRGKSGHHRAGFPTKAGGTCVKTSSRPVPQKINRSLQGVRVKRWGKSPPLFEQLNGHGKPNPMQDEIGNRAARLWFRVRRTPLIWGFDLSIK